MKNAFIVSTGAYIPEQIITNQYFNDYFGEDIDTWLRENVHIYERRWCKEGESVADLCEKAAKQALERAGITADKLDLLIIATDTPEFISPATAAVVQHRIGATNAGTFDLNAACAGFVTGLDVAAKYILADKQYEYVMVIGAYAMSKYLNKDDKKTVTLFADGAGAVILRGGNEKEKRGFLASELMTKGEFYDWMGIYAGATHTPMTEEVLKNKDHLLKFVKKFPKELNPTIWTTMAQTLCERLKIQPSNIDHFFMTQININAIWDTLDRLNVPHHKAETVMHYYGYTGSAAIPIALNQRMEKGTIKRGDMLFFIGSGGGLAFASAAVKF
jgi:3-oxoacyl-[acyl-carrier-protein] synthase III